MAYVVTLTESDWSEVRVILMDRDEKAALQFLKEKVAKPIERSGNKTLDVTKGHA